MYKVMLTRISFPQRYLYLSQQGVHAISALPSTHNPVTFGSPTFLYLFADTAMAVV